MNRWLQNMKSSDKMLIMVCVGLLFVLLTWPQNKQTEKTDSVIPETKTWLSYEEKTEQNLKEILSRVEGAGEVEVMITYRTSEEKILQEERTVEEVKEQESQENGTIREQTEYREETNSLMTGGNEDTPYVVKELMPEIEGVLVLAEGADRAAVKADIIDAIRALFPIDSHKIKVLKRESTQKGES